MLSLLLALSLVEGLARVEFLTHHEPRTLEPSQLGGMVITA